MKSMELEVTERKLKHIGIQNYLAYEYVALHPCTLSPRERKGKGVW
jgi:hypothetical protein